MPTVHTVTEKESRANDSTLAVAKNLKQQHHHLKFKSEQDIAQALCVTNRLPNPRNLPTNLKFNIGIVLDRTKKLPAEQMRDLCKESLKCFTQVESKCKQSTERLKRSNGDLEEVRRVCSQHGIHLTNEDVKTIVNGSDEAVRHKTNEFLKKAGDAAFDMQMKAHVNRYEAVPGNKGKVLPLSKVYSWVSKLKEALYMTRKYHEAYEDSYAYYVSHGLKQDVAKFAAFEDGVLAVLLELVSTIILSIVAGGTAGIAAGGAAGIKVGGVVGGVVGIAVGVTIFTVRQLTAQKMDTVFDRWIEKILAKRREIQLDHAKKKSKYATGPFTDMNLDLPKENEPTQTNREGWIVPAEKRIQKKPRKKGKE